METYVSSNNCVAKYVHDDGSETSIKTLAPGEESCGGTNRNKFNVFASCSVGCQINCGMCFLHSKKYSFKTLTKQEMQSNVYHAILRELKRRPELLNVPINLSWMGMGEPWLKLRDVYNVSASIIDYFKGILTFEGVDIATTLPQINFEDFNYLKLIDKKLKEGKLTEKPKGRTNVRIFYSLHGVNNRIRRSLIPKTLDLHVALPYLDNIQKKFNVIYHYMFLDYVNDHSNDINALIDKFGRHTAPQLRILRYNKCPNSKFEESKYFENLIIQLANYIPNLKVQLSAGSEIQAACGQFLMHYKDKV